jgi:TetR/AcrR family transcriptional regulator, tetracycline repressor protein
MAIDKQRAVSVALRLLDARGLEQLTLRRIAGELGVQAPALYWHFANKRALLDHMTDQMLAAEAANLGRPEPSLPWWQWLAQTARALRRGLLAHRDGAQIALGADLNRAQSLGVFVERITDVLHSAGFDLRDASRAAGALMWFVVGRTVEEQSQPDAEAVRALTDSGRFPTVARAMAVRKQQGDSSDEAFEYSLTIMLTGLRCLRGSGAGPTEVAPLGSRS